MLNSGKLRHRVTLQAPFEVQDQNNGAISIVWQDVANLWASIEPLSAKEFMAAQAERNKITARVTIRYRGDITPKMRLYYVAKDKHFNIEGVLSDKDSGFEYLTLPVSEGLKDNEVSS